MRLKSLAFAALTALSLTSCVTARATQFSLPKDRVTECQQLCSDVGLKMSALVIIMNSSGCVCEPANATTTMNSSTAAVVGGAVIAASASQQQQQNAATHH